LALALRAAPGVPVVGRAVAVEVFHPAALVAGFGAQHHAVADVGPQQAVVRVVGGADPTEPAIDPVLVAVDLLPAAVGVVADRVGHAHRVEPHERGCSRPAEGGQAEPQEVAALHDWSSAKPQAAYSSRRSCQIETCFCPLRSRAAPSQIAKATDAVWPGASEI